MGGFERHEQWRQSTAGAHSVLMGRALLVDLVVGAGKAWTLANYTRAMIDAYTARDVTCPIDVAREYCTYMIPKDYMR